jgi:hypothetical protein
VDSHDDDHYLTGPEGINLLSGLTARPNVSSTSAGSVHVPFTISTTQSGALHSLFLREMFLQNRDDTDEFSLVGSAGTGKDTRTMTINTIIEKLVVLARTVDGGDSRRDPATITTEEATMTADIIPNIVVRIPLKL